MIRVRRAGPEDLTAVTRLFTGYLTFYGRQHPEADVAAFMQARLAGSDARIYLAVDGEQPVGLAQVYPTFSSLALAPAWVLNDLFTDPEARGRGAGRALLRAVCDAAQHAGAAYVTLETTEDNTSARALYESDGFTTDRGFRHYSRQLLRSERDGAATGHL